MGRRIRDALALEPELAPVAAQPSRNCSPVRAPRSPPRRRPCGIRTECARGTSRARHGWRKRDRRRDRAPLRRRGRAGRRHGAAPGAARRRGSRDRRASQRPATRRAAADAERAVALAVEHFGRTRRPRRQRRRRGRRARWPTPTTRSGQAGLARTSRAASSAAREALPELLADGRRLDRHRLLDRRALLSRPAMAGYTTAKTGLLGLMRSLAVDYGPEGVRVNARLPRLGANADGRRRDGRPRARDGVSSREEAYAAGARRRAAPRGRRAGGDRRRLPLPRLRASRPS